MGVKESKKWRGAMSSAIRALAKNRPPMERCVDDHRDVPVANWSKSWMSCLRGVRSCGCAPYDVVNLEDFFHARCPKFWMCSLQCTPI